MVRSDLPLWLVTACVVLLTPGLRAGEPAEPTSSLANTLAIQDTMRQARELVQRGQTKSAVDALEAQLGRINGNPQYLALLRDTYYAYLKELQLAGRSDEVAEYLKRLKIIDKTAKVDDPTAPPKYGKAAEKVARGVADDDPLQQASLHDQSAPADALPQAEKAFVEQRYGDAARLYAQAAERDPNLQGPARGRWAYCKIAVVVARLRQTENLPNAPVLPQLEEEVRIALSMAPKDGKLDAFGQKVLGEIRQRRNSGPAVEVRHGERGTDGWDRCESQNFHLFHHQPREGAEMLLRAAEQARSLAFEKWGGQAAAPWRAACEVYVYTTSADYAQATSQPASAPGHSTIKSQGGTVTSRRIDLHADEANLFGCVLPHEVTHVVLGDLFAGVPLPRWADEGMAVLAESPSQVERFTHTLVSRRQQGQLIHLKQLLARADYPDPAGITVFYVESVSIVEYLATARGPAEFVRFVRDLPQGTEVALKKHYEIAGVDELEARWLISLQDRGLIQAKGR